MSERFFLESPPKEDLVEFPEAESSHIARVMRLAPGDQVGAFDGRGNEFKIELVDVNKKRVRGRVIHATALSRESSVVVTLAVALPKGERQRWLIEKCVELGVSKLVPLITKRGVAQPVEKAIERLRRAVIEASKQCGRNHLMQVEQGTTLKELLSQLSPEDTNLILHPSGDQTAWQPDATQSVVGLIGPEGGFSEEEVEQATSAGCLSVSFGPRILRVETAALALAARLVD